MSNIQSSPFPVREVVVMVPGLLIGLWVGARLFEGMEAYQIVAGLGGFTAVSALSTLIFVILLLLGRPLQEVTKQALGAGLILSFAGAILIGVGLARLLQL